MEFAALNGVYFTMAALNEVYEDSLVSRILYGVVSTVMLGNGLYDHWLKTTFIYHFTKLIFDRGSRSDLLASLTVTFVLRNYTLILSDVFCFIMIGHLLTVFVKNETLKKLVSVSMSFILVNAAMDKVLGYYSMKPLLLRYYSSEVYSNTVAAAVIHLCYMVSLLCGY